MYRVYAQDFAVADQPRHPPPLAPLLGNDRKRIELLNALCSPCRHAVLYYATKSGWRQLFSRRPQRRPHPDAMEFGQTPVLPRESAKSVPADVTTDGSKRISSCSIIQSSFSKPTASSETEDLANRLVPALQLQDFAILLRRRVLQCFALDQFDAILNKVRLCLSQILIGLTMRTFTDLSVPS